MANTLITPSVIAKEALIQLENNLVMGNLVHRDYKKEFVKVGGTVSIRTPVKFVANDGATLVKQDVTEGTTSITVDKQKHVGWAFNTQDLTLKVEEYSARYIKPAMIKLANTVDRDVLSLYKDLWNWTGTPGQAINSFADFAKGPERLDLGAVPQDMRNAVMSPTDTWAMLGSQTALYMQNTANDAYRKAKLGMIGGVDTHQDQNVNTHTVGAYSGAPLIAGANQNVTYASVRTTHEQSLITDGWGANITVKQGDVFTIAGVFAVNPVSKDVLPHLQQFVVKADGTADGVGALTLTISPAIITSGAYQTVNAAPADNAAITVLGTASTGYAQNLAFHKNAFGLVMVPLEMPDGVSFKARESDNGVSVRVIKQYDINTDEDIIRLDILYGIKTLYPDLATRMSGTA